MFAGFKMSISSTDKECFVSEYDYGKTIFVEQQKSARNTIEKYINPDGRISAEEIENEWFSQMSADVFISHSHDDAEMAIGLAGYLQHEYGIKCFIDSCVWGYANDLLRMIDDRFCKTIRNKDGTLSYDYDKRNQSTSHVHSILNGALAKMIDSTECLVFLNTPCSLSANECCDESKTASPWIYSELLMATQYPHRELMEYRSELMHGSIIKEHFYASLKVDYNVRTDKLVALSISDIQTAAQKCTRESAQTVLDQLYADKNLLNETK